jgi:hypothetical protein
MGFLKVEQVDGQISLVPDEEALAMLKPSAGDILAVKIDADGRVTLTSAVSKEERVNRGKAFLNRYRKTFEALAK